MDNLRFHEYGGEHMSVRAYKIIQMSYEHTETFNLWHDEELVTLLDPVIPDYFHSESGGYLEFRQEDLEEVWQKAVETTVSKETCELLQQMIADAKKSEFGWVKYWCF
jgi:hypothetical protein